MADSEEKIEYAKQMLKKFSRVHTNNLVRQKFGRGFADSKLVKIKKEVEQKNENYQ